MPRVLASAVIVLGVVAGGYWLVRPPALPAEASLPYTVTDGTSVRADGVPTTAVEVAAPPGTTATAVTVHVAGAVVHPGVYSLRSGARAIDAVAAAGGLAADADADRINLASLLVDGQRVFVPRLGEDDPLPTATVGDGPAAPAGPLDLNVATAAELETLPGIGPTTAAAIVAYRDLHGPFSSVDDLADVAGIGPSKLEAIRGLVTV
ncbi:MAG: ComEA family DNA-binding protein [Ilumatobacteraceae bacterium]